MIVYDVERKYSPYKNGEISREEFRAYLVRLVIAHAQIPHDEDLFEGKKMHVSDRFVHQVLKIIRHDP